MKILITSDWYTPAVNGVVASILALRRQLEARGHEVRVLTLSGTVHTTCENGVYAVGSVDAGLIYPGARLRSFAPAGGMETGCGALPVRVQHLFSGPAHRPGGGGAAHSHLPHGV